MREVDVLGVRVEMPSNQPIVLLRETAGDRYLPIWIGAVEATAIAFAQQGVVPPAAADARPDEGHARGDRQRAERGTASPTSRTASSSRPWCFASGAEVSARPSDSIALALRTGTTIFCSEEVLDEAGHRGRRPSRRTRSRGSASSSTMSRPRTSNAHDPRARASPTAWRTASCPRLARVCCRTCVTRGHAATGL